MKSLFRGAVVGVAGAALVTGTAGAGAQTPSRETAATVVTAADTPVPKIKVTSSGFVRDSDKATFTPRGANFVRLQPLAGGGSYHSTFEPGLYDGALAKQALVDMRASGYNFVRVFIDSGSFTAPFHGNSANVDSEEPVRAEYMNNVAAFVKEAANQGIYVMPSIDYIPANKGYYKIAGTPAANIADVNIKYLDKGFVTAKAEYMAQFAKDLIKRLGPQHKNAVLAYAADNEAFFDASKAPYNAMSGSVTTLDGKTYDMSKPVERQQSADANLIKYSQLMKQALQSVDPELLLTMGFFTNAAVGKQGFDGLTFHCDHNCDPQKDYRVPGRSVAISKQGALDFVDLHVYPSGKNYDLNADMQSIDGGKFERPLLIGEMGAPKSAYGNDIGAAAVGMRDLQVASCTYKAKGWAFWTWDTTEDLADQRRFYNLKDQGGAINAQLAPTVRFDPCTKEPTKPSPTPTPTTTATAPPTGIPTSTPTDAPTTKAPEPSASQPEDTTPAPAPGGKSSDLAHTGSSGSLPLILGGGVVLVLAGAGAVVVFRKRRRGMPGEA